MWGGTPDRNLVSNMKNAPTEWDVKTKKNIKWVAELGSQSYGNPVVAGGMVFVGTNNELLRDPKQGGDRGVLMAFRESDGQFLWQHTHAKLEAGRANDWPFQGVASSPLVEGEILYYVSNRGVVIALDIQGFRDNNENDGPFKDEKLTGQNDADVIWTFDMIEEVGSYPHNLSNSSPVVARRSDLPEHLERTGREPRPHPVAACAVDHRAQQEHGQTCLGRQLGRGPDPARAVVDALCGHDRRRRAGRLRARRRLGPRLRGSDRQEALGVRHQPEGLGMAAHAQRADRDAGDLSGRGLHRQRPGPRARRRRRPHVRDRRHQARRHHQDRTGLALRQDPPVDLHCRHRRRVCCTSPTSAAISTAWTPRPVRSTGITTCWPPSGRHRSSSTARSTSATKTATSS